MSATRRPGGLLLDWDGTLLDSYRAQLAATKFAITAHGGTWSLDRFLAHPTDWRAHYRSAGIAEVDLTAASSTYHRAYAERRSRLRPYAKQALFRLVDAGVALAIVTSGTNHRVMPEIREHGLGDILTVIVTFDDVFEPKPSPEGLAQAIGRLNITAAEAISIGDTGVDKLAAEAAGVRDFIIRSPYTAEPHKRHAMSSWHILERRLLADFGIGG